jgi:hypothetical protein
MADLSDWQMKVQCSFSKVGYQLGHDYNLRQSFFVIYNEFKLINRTILMYDLYVYMG